jgi:hypothetical protein
VGRIIISSASGVDVERFIVSGDRQSIVNQASEKSLSLLYDAIKKH